MLFDSIYIRLVVSGTLSGSIAYGTVSFCECTPRIAIAARMREVLREGISRGVRSGEDCSMEGKFYVSKRGLP